MIAYFVGNEIYWWALLRLHSSYLPGMIILATSFAFLSFLLTIVRTAFGIHRKHHQTHAAAGAEPGGILDGAVPLGNVRSRQHRVDTFGAARIIRMPPPPSKIA